MAALLEVAADLMPHGLMGYRLGGARCPLPTYMAHPLAHSLWPLPRPRAAVSPGRTFFSVCMTGPHPHWTGTRPPPPAPWIGMWCLSPGPRHGLLCVDGHSSSSAQRGATPPPPSSAPFTSLRFHLPSLCLADNVAPLVSQPASDQRCSVLCCAALHCACSCYAARAAHPTRAH